MLNLTLTDRGGGHSIWTPYTCLGGIENEKKHELCCRADDCLLACALRSSCRAEPTECTRRPWHLHPGSHPVEGRPRGGASGREMGRSRGRSREGGPFHDTALASSRIQSSAALASEHRAHHRYLGHSQH